jgi:hypothetical protein
MIPNDDPRWVSLHGAYRVPYDPRPALARLRVDGKEQRAWSDLWENLHHQGDLGEASYVALVALVQMRAAIALSSGHFFGLTSTIEVQRRRRTNPDVPEWLAADYRDAWSELLHYASKELEAGNDPEVLQSAAAVMCLAKGLIVLGTVVWYHDQGTLLEYLEERLAWTELYAKRPGDS